MNHGTNAQQIYSLLALFTCLEALLGVINACLPVLKPIFNRLGDSGASAWLSSVMSGTIPIFMRPSQMGSRWTTPAATTTKKKKQDSATGKEMPEMPRWPGGPGGPATTSPPPRYVDGKAADMMFASPVGVRSPSSSSPVRPRGPPVPPKEDDYRASPAKDWERRKGGRGIRVQKEWDVERSIGEESDRQPLDPRRDYNYNAGR